MRCRAMSCAPVASALVFPVPESGEASEERRAAGRGQVGGGVIGEVT
jgi:hypothetical protein